MLASLKETFPNAGQSTLTVGKEPPPRMSASVGANRGRNQYNNAGGAFTQQPDIVLREPLDTEFVLNRKLAKQLF